MTAPSQSDIPTTSSPSSLRGKVNEIDFCIAPADVSLSRAYSQADGVAGAATATTATTSSGAVGLSLTRALNNASNRAVRRILLARSWPSAEALNESLRQVAALEAAARKQQQAKQSSSTGGAKCPVPRPILNVLTRSSQRSDEIAAATVSSDDDISSDDATTKSPTAKSRKNKPQPRSRTDAEYVADQLQSFRERYGTFTGYGYAQDYLECVLSLATSGVESPQARAVLSAGIYDEAYKRVLAVLRTVGVIFEKDEATGRMRIADKLRDQDICWSVMDKIRMRQEQQQASQQHGQQASQQVEQQESGDLEVDGAEEKGDNETEVAPAMSSAKEDNEAKNINGSSEKKKKGLQFWKRKEDTVYTWTRRDDLGGVLLSAEEPTMTRQLNVLSNIVQRALLFGGDQELLVLAETLDADRAAFIERWFPGTDTTTTTAKSADRSADSEKRSGLQFFDSLILLLRQCYDKGVVTDLDPPLKLSASYANAYERLVASSVELGSGYLKPTFGLATSAGFSSMPKPRTAQEELGRFAVLETKFRAQSARPTSQYSPYPMDLVGSWEVRDEIGGETIGSSTVELLENGNVKVAPPLEGLRWRLDPGPTHLDTCTFQVLSTLDGTILQYRGFIDRGARLEARFSKRLIKIRGSVQFQMRDGASIDYYKDMLPINYRTGTTKFVMTKLSE